MISSSRLGDSHVCPLPGHSTTAILTASDDVIINGMALLGSVMPVAAAR